jgi:hypothetical protein
MDTFLGIAVDVWVNVDGDCPMGFETSASQAQIELGHNTGSLHLVMTEGGLETLVEVAGLALEQMRGPQQ